MALQVINNGSFDFDPSAEKVRVSMDKIKAMFSEIYGAVPFDFTTKSGFILAVNGTEDGYTLVSASGLGDMLGGNNLVELTNAAAARGNLGLGTAAVSNTTDFATTAQGAKADSALQGITVGAGGLTVDVTDPQNPILDVALNAVFVNGISFDASTGILSLSRNGAAALTLNLSAYTVLKIDGFTVEKAAGNTNLTTIEVNDIIEGNLSPTVFIKSRVNALPYTTDTNRTDFINSDIS